MLRTMSARIAAGLMVMSVLAIACGPSIAIEDDSGGTAEDGPGADDDGSSVTAATTTSAPMTTVGDADVTGADDTGDTGEVPSICGDGILAPEESCDDANADPYDGCNAECRVPGEVLWEVAVDGVEITGLAVGPDGVFASAITYDFIQVDNSAWIAHVHAIDHAGNPRWSSTSALGYTAWDDALAANVAGGAFVSGGDFPRDEGNPTTRHVRAFATDGNVEWTTLLTENPGALLAHPGGGVVMINDAIDDTTRVLRLDPAGGAPWETPTAVPGDLRGLTFTPAGELVLGGEGGIVVLDDDGAIAWSAMEPEVIRGWIIADTLELLAGYEAPRMVAYALDGTRLGEREAPNFNLRVVPGGGYVSEADEVIVRWDDDLQPRWDVQDEWGSFRLAVEPTRLVIGGPPPAPDGSVLPLQVVAIAI